MSKKKRKNSHLSIETHHNDKLSNYKFIFFLFLVFTAALYYNQWVTLEKLSNVINPISKFGTFGSFISFLHKYGYKIFTGFDTFIFYLILLIPLLLLFFEWKNQTITKIIDLLPKSHKALISYLFVLSLFFLRSYFAKGHDLYTGDAPYFLLLTRLMKDSFIHFKIFPFWTFLYGGGAPFNQFYGPLHSYIAGFLAVFFNIYTATKLTLFIFHFVSAAGVYLFIQQLTQSKKAGFISGLAAILLYHHIHVILFPGRYGIASIWAVYPFLFYFFEKSIEKENLISFLGIAVSISFMIFASIGMSFYFFLFWGIYAASRLLFWEVSIKRKLTWSVFFLTAVLLGFMLSSYYIYSFLFETQWSVKQTFDKFKIGGIGHNIFKQIFLWNNYQVSLFNFTYSWQTSYFGLSLLILTGIAFFSILLKKSKQYFAFILTFLILLFYIIGYGKISFLIKIPYLHTYSQARLFNILAFFIIFLTGIGALYLLQIINKKQSFLLIILIILSDLFFTTFHDTWGLHYGDYAYPFLTKIKMMKPKYSLAPYRFDLVGKNKSRSIQHNWRAFDAFMAETGQPVISESVWDFKQLRQFVNFSKQKILPSSVNGRLWAKYYYLFNTKYILSTQTIPPDFVHLISRNQRILFYQTITNTPVFLTSKITNCDFSTNKISDFFNSVTLNFSNATANQMWVTDYKTTNIQSGSLKSVLQKHIIKNNSVFIRFTSSSPAFAVLSYSAYPTIKVILNGRQIKFHKTFYGNILIPVPKGRNEIKIIPSRTKAALITLLTAIFLYLLIFFIIIYQLKLRKHL